MAASNHDSNRDPTPRRQVERCIKPAFHLTDCATLQVLAGKLQKRIRQTLYARGAGTMVAINGQGEVYLLMAGEARTDKFYAENYGIVMGVYAELPMGGGNATVPDLDVLAEDIRFHLPAGALIDEPAQAAEPKPVQLELVFPPLHEFAAAA
ncbi:hypothetical protein ARC78_14900 [Stenotrophomonas pictorum JCM 9942]|uniref:Uncharacterized protein n=1 Tax=Stenotrophomonas pictorum JCM 9942 TaxID=1236960 RepID=A0A0R0ACF6_9GAMM|nr:hypothetical protein [Stenotrophomonas pictorum]KRG39105.1 hypothetical protein ARC78_14900 [Stenotrophomonas pictorum JCM 9942]